MRGDRADQVAPCKGCRLRSQATLTDEVANIDYIETALRRVFPAEQRGDHLGVEPHRCRSLAPLGDHVVAGWNLVLALTRGEHRQLVAVPAVHRKGGVHGRDLAGAPAELLAHPLRDTDHLEGAVPCHRDRNPELTHQRITEHGLTHGTSGLCVSVQRDTVELSPGAVVTQHVVGDRNVGVELRVDGGAPVAGSVTGREVRCRN